jgi:hypothetical protein
MTKIINLTPHPINIIGLEEIKPSGNPARLEEVTENYIDILIKGIRIPVIKKKLGSIIGLPESQPETILVVSLPVAQAAHRSDVFAIGESVRDKNGNVVGAKSLATF